MSIRTTWQKLLVDDSPLTAFDDACLSILHSGTALVDVSQIECCVAEIASAVHSPPRWNVQRLLDETFADCVAVERHFQFILDSDAQIARTASAACELATRMSIGAAKEAAAARGIAEVSCRVRVREGGTGKAQCVTTDMFREWHTKPDPTLGAPALARIEQERVHWQRIIDGMKCS